MKILGINNTLLKIIDNNTISLIIKNPDETFKLILFKNSSPVFEKNYKSFTGAKIAKSKLKRKFCY